MGVVAEVEVRGSLGGV